MKLFDMLTEQVFTLADLKKDYNEFKQEDPENHCETFKAELFEILMATVNGRNDCEIIGMTEDETERYIINLRKQVLEV